MAATTWTSICNSHSIDGFGLFQHDCWAYPYTGIAQRGRVQERLTEHLQGGKDPIPGVKVRVEQMESIDAAREKEARIIKRSQPSHNKQGK